MNKKLPYSKQAIIEWMLSLPKGENDSKIEAAINNCKSLGKSHDETITFINIAFKNEIDNFIEWLEENH